MGDEQGGEGHGAILSSKAAGGAEVVFVSAVEAFDQLLEGAKFGRDLVAILQAYYLPQGKGGLGSGALSVEEVHAGLVRGVAVIDEMQGAIFRQGTGCLA